MKPHAVTFLPPVLYTDAVLGLLGSSMPSAGGMPLPQYHFHAISPMPSRQPSRLVPDPQQATLLLTKTPAKKCVGTMFSSLAPAMAGYPSAYKTIQCLVALHGSARTHLIQRR